MSRPYTRAGWAEYYAKRAPGSNLMWWYMILAEAERQGDL